MGMENQLLSMLTAPAVPTADALRIEFELWKIERNAYQKKKEAHDHNNGRIYALVLGECSEALRNRMEGHEDWADVNAATDAMGLLTLIRGDKASRPG